MPAFANAADLRRRVGESFGPTEWLTVAQERIDAFADATGDHQWIHVDPDRAAASPFGGTIAHGFLTLSLIPTFAEELIRFEGAVTGINYGLDRVRFPTPVPSGARIRGTVQITEAAEIPGGIQVVQTWTVTVDGLAKPACVADCIVRFLDDITPPPHQPIGTSPEE